jgi:flagellar basal-body rod protein FlgG
MLRAFSTAATGMTAQQTMVDTIANNLANVNTTGFKRSQVDFKDLLYTQMTEPGAEVASGIKNPGGTEIGSGVRVASTPKIFTGGELENTGNKLDVAIQGAGLFEVTLPNGDLRYTRDGAFKINADGLLVTSGGHPISPSITIPNDTESIEIGIDGTITTVNSTGTANAGQLSLARFPNPSGLKSEGNNLLSESDASGTALVGTAGTAGYGSLMPGFLEKSNVQMVTELVSLIKAQRAYEINSRAIRAGDDMLRTANEIVR